MNLFLWITTSINTHKYMM